MKIYKNNVCVTMDLDEFLDILESDMFDDLLTMINELDDSPSAIEEIYGDYTSTNDILDELTLEEIEDFFDAMIDSIEDEYLISAHDADTLFEGEGWWTIAEEFQDRDQSKTDKGKKKK